MIADLAGNELGSDDTWSSTTAGIPPAPVRSGRFTQPGRASAPLGRGRGRCPLHHRHRRLHQRRPLCKGASNTHPTGNLWSNTRTLLARATFTAETGSGWHKSTSTPPSLSARTTYIASYHAPNGHYALNLNYFTTAYSNGPLQAPATNNGIFRYSTTSNFPTDSYQASTYWVDVVFTTQAPADTTPPTITAQPQRRRPTPTPPLPPPPSAKALDPSTVGSSTVQLRTSSGALVAATVAWDAIARRATLTPTTPLATNSSYTATIESGSNGIADLAGNQLGSDYTWSFTTAGIPSCPCSLWAASAQPGLAASADSAAVEVGVRFTTATAGYISGVRFYKGASNTGTHTGNLWTHRHPARPRHLHRRNRQRLATSQLRHPRPVSAGTTYIASYHDPNGHYALNLNYFTTAYSNGPSKPPPPTTASSATAPPATFPPTATKPATTGSSVFTTQAPADTTPPTITSTSPSAAATRTPTPPLPSPPPSAKRSTPAPSAAAPSSSAPAPVRSSQPRSPGTRSPGAQP